MNRNDRPRSDRPRGDKPRGDRPFARGPRDDRPSRAGSSFSRGPRDDRPRSERPSSGPRREGGGGGGWGRPAEGQGGKDRGFSRAPREDRGADRGFSRAPREDRGGDRGFSRPPREDRGFSRAPREDRGFARGPREDRPRSSFSPRPEGRSERPFTRAPKEGFRDRSEATEAPARSDRPHVGEDELRCLGKNACLALFKNRPDDIVRIYVRKEDKEQYADLIKFCVENRKSYHLVTDQDLEKLTDSRAHQGICMIAKNKDILYDKTLLSRINSARDIIIYLDGVANPHNFGGIIRTAAHFGVSTIAAPEENLPRLNGATARTAEGGAEYVNLVSVRDDESFLEQLKAKGYVIYGLESSAEKSQSLYETRLNDKAVFILGNEETGICGRVKAQLDCSIKIPGTGHLESLNVSVAAALAMGEFQRQAKEPNRRMVKTKS